MSYGWFHLVEFVSLRQAWWLDNMGDIAELADAIRQAIREGKA